MKNDADKKADADRALDYLGERQKLNSESFDKFLISLSSAGIALVITYGKDGEIQQNTVWLYYFSIIFFVFTVGIVLLSFLISNNAIEKNIKYWADVRNRNNDSGRVDAYNNEKKSNDLIKICSIISYITFMIAIMCVSILACINQKEPKPMTDKKPAPPTSTRAQFLPPQAAIPQGEAAIPSVQNSGAASGQPPKAEPTLPQSEN